MIRNDQVDIKKDLPQAMNQMVIMRYDANNPLMKNAKEKMDILRYGIEEGKIEGLHSLVVAILSLEAGYNEAPISIQNMWSEIIIEELQKKDIPIEVIRGW